MARAYLSYGPFLDKDNYYEDRLFEILHEYGN